MTKRCAHHDYSLDARRKLIASYLKEALILAGVAGIIMLILKEIIKHAH